MSHAFHDIPPERYPFTITAHTVSDDMEVWRVEIARPGEVHIPPLARHYNEPVRIRIHWPDGTVETEEPFPPHA